MGFNLPWYGEKFKLHNRWAITQARKSNGRGDTTEGLSRSGCTKPNLLSIWLSAKVKAFCIPVQIASQLYLGLYSPLHGSHPVKCVTKDLLKLIVPVTPILQMLLSHCTIELAHLLKLAHVSTRFMDHWQFWIKNAQHWDLSSFSSWPRISGGSTHGQLGYGLCISQMESWTPCLWRLHLSIHLIHSASGWANIAARRTGFLDQALLLLDGIKCCCKRCPSHGFCNSLLCSWTSLASGDLQHDFYTLWAGTLLP